jgi:hypothetical protein
VTNSTRPIRVAYADPPYPGCARFYSVPGTPEYHPDAAEWDDPARHVRLIQELERDFPDGWALSTSSTALDVLHPRPAGSRVAVYCHPGVQNAMVGREVAAVAFMWEAVIYRVPQVARGTRVSTPDCVWASAGHNHTQGFYGSKPPKFCRWLLSLLRLGAHPDDEFVDLFPGSGNVTRAWQEFRAGRVVARDGSVQAALFGGES